jgi:YD repeat-containing protein
VTAKAPVGRPASERVTYTYDTPSITGSYAIGRLSRIDDGSGTTRFAYDHRGNLVTRFQKLIGTPDWVALRFAYDLADRIELVTYPSGRQVRYVRDAKGRVASVRTRANNAVATWTNVATAMSYEAFGSLKTMNLGNGERLVTNYGDDGRLDGRRLFKQADGVNQSHLTYAYDADDNMIRITDHVDASRTQNFAYDEVGRLTRVTTASGDMRRTDYVFDGNGNRTRELRRPLPDDPASAATIDRYTLAAGSNRLARVTTPAGNRDFTYDHRGNLVSETRPGGISVSTAYDGYGRLTGYVRSGEANLTHVYNGMDDRVATTSGSDPRRFIYAPDGRVLGEYGNNASDVKAEYIWMQSEVGEASASLFGGDDGLGGYSTSS